MNAHPSRGVVLVLVGIGIAVGCWIYQRSGGPEGTALDVGVLGESHPDGPDSAGSAWPSLTLQSESPVTAMRTIVEKIGEVPKTPDVALTSQAFTAEGWISRLKAARVAFELDLTHPDELASSAFFLVSLSVTSELDRQDRYQMIPKGETLPLAGSKVSKGEIRIALGDKLYSFREGEYPIYEVVRSLRAGAPDKSSIPQGADVFSPEVIAAVNDCYETAISRRESPPETK